LHPDAPITPSRHVVGVARSARLRGGFHPGASGAVRRIRASRDPTTSDVLIGASTSPELSGHSGGNVYYTSIILEDVRRIEARLARHDGVEATITCHTWHRPLIHEPAKAVRGGNTGPLLLSKCLDLQMHGNKSAQPRRGVYRATMTVVPTTRWVRRRGSRRPAQILCLRGMTLQSENQESQFATSLRCLGRSRARCSPAPPDTAREARPPQDRAHGSHSTADTASRCSSCSPLVAEELKTLSKEIS